MKYFNIIAFFLAFSTVNRVVSQIAIGKTSIDGDAILDFGHDVRGLILSPIVDVTTSNSQPGTIAFDGNTGSFRYLDDSGNWSPAIIGGVTGGVQAGTDGAQFLVGTKIASASAVLQLGEDTNETKALVLPKLANGNLRFNNPVAGLIYYDTVLKAVLVYNGISWTRF